MIDEIPQISVLMMNLAVLALGLRISHDTDVAYTWQDIFRDHEEKGLVSTFEPAVYKVLTFYVKLRI